jgi:hypothetical protein
MKTFKVLARSLHKECQEAYAPYLQTHVFY